MMLLRVRIYACFPVRRFIEKHVTLCGQGTGSSNTRAEAHAMELSKWLIFWLSWNGIWTLGLSKRIPFFAVSFVNKVFVGVR